VARFWAHALLMCVLLLLGSCRPTPDSRGARRPMLDTGGAGCGLGKHTHSWCPGCICCLQAVVDVLLRMAAGVCLVLAAFH
jgi:hypothetical protein